MKKDIFTRIMAGVVAICVFANCNYMTYAHEDTDYQINMVGNQDNTESDDEIVDVYNDRNEESEDSPSINEIDYENYNDESVIPEASAGNIEVEIDSYSNMSFLGADESIVENNQVNDGVFILSQDVITQAEENAGTICGGVLAKTNNSSEYYITLQSGTWNVTENIDLSKNSCGKKIYLSSGKFIFQGDGAISNGTIKSSSWRTAGVEFIDFSLENIVLNELGSVKIDGGIYDVSIGYTSEVVVNSGTFRNFEVFHSYDCVINSGSFDGIFISDVDGTDGYGVKILDCDVDASDNAVTCYRTCVAIYGGTFNGGKDSYALNTAWDGGNGFQVYGGTFSGGLGAWYLYKNGMARGGYFKNGEYGAIVCDTQRSFPSENAGKDVLEHIADGYILKGETVEKKIDNYYCSVAIGEEGVEVVKACTVTFDYDGKMENEEIAVAQNSLLDKPSDPLINGYMFLGWYHDDEIWNFETDIVLSDMVLQARWKKDEYVVSFEPNIFPNNCESIIVVYGEPYGELPKLEIENYRFEGWYTEPEEGSLITKESIVTIREDHVLYAHWKKISFNVMFDVNGGNEEFNSIRVKYGESYGELPTPTKAHSRFIGWYTARDGGSHITSDSIVMLDDDITLYAHWVIEHYRVSFKDYKGNLIDAALSVTYGNEYGELPIPEQRVGYTFDGWFTKSEGGIKISSTSIVTIDSDHTLYEHWLVNSYVVSFNAKGGNVTKSSKTVYYGSTYGELPIPTREGYGFTGWYTAETGGEKVTENTIVSTADDIILYAHWTGNCYTISFENYDGNMLIKTICVIYGENYGELPAPEARTGCTFLGWFTEKENGIQITSESIVETAKDHTLYAHWSINRYKVSFNAMEGECDTESIEVEYGKPYGTLPTPHRKGHTFAGWGPSEWSRKFITKDTVVNTANDHTLYAQWDMKSIYINFDPNGGSMRETRKSYHYGRELDHLPTPYAREGYSFVGWFTEKEGSKQITTETVLDWEEEITLYAHWDPNHYTVSFEDSDGTKIEQTLDVAHDGRYGDFGHLPELKPRTGYTFLGWFTAKEGGERVDESKKLVYNNDHTLYAHWEGKKITVSLDSQGGKVSKEQLTVTYGNNYGILPSPTKEGYTFDGWYTQKEEGNRVDNNTLVTNLENHTLYARWNPMKIKVIFDPSEGKVEEASREADYGSAYGELPVANRTGYKFLGWFTAKNGGKQITEDSVIDSIKEIHLYAQWEIVKYTVSFEDHDGTRLDTIIQVTYESNYGKLPVPAERKGYSFAGWYDASEGGSKITFESKVKVAEDHVLYARWEEILATSVLLSYNEVKMYVGQNKTVEATVRPADALDTTVTWNSSDDSVVSVTDGQLSALKSGMAAITATTADGKHSATLTVTVLSSDIDEEMIEGTDDVPDGLWISGLDETYDFTGSKITPRVKVYYGCTLLREKAEYTISYKNNVNVGTASVIITGKGNYKGTCSETFAINGAELQPSDVDPITVAASSVKYAGNGKILSAVVKVNHDGKELKQGKDYEVYTGSGRISAGDSVPVTVKGIGNYKGELSMSLIVKDKTGVSINKVTVSGLKKSYSLDMAKELQDNNTVTLKYKSQAVDSSSYTFKFENCDRVGKGTLLIRATSEGSFVGEKRVTFNITGKTLGSMTVSKGAVYNGKVQNPKIVVYSGKKSSGEILPEEAYKVSFSADPVNAGTVTVTVEGNAEAGYSGKLTAKYTISARPITSSGVKAKMPGNISYSQGGAKPSPLVTLESEGTIWTLREGVDYTLSYDNRKPLTGKCTITGKGNFSGKVVKEYPVSKTDINSLYVSCPDVTYNSKKNRSYYFVKPVVVDSTGKVLKEKTDYTYSYTVIYSENEAGSNDALPVGTKVRVDITATDKNYTGSIYAIYEVVETAKDISKATAKIENQAYTGKPVEVKDVKLTFTNGTGKSKETKTLVKGKDYVITNYYNNVKQGTASVRVEGIGEYSGSKVISFKIVPANAKNIWRGRYGKK